MPVQLLRQIDFLVFLHLHLFDNYTPKRLSEILTQTPFIRQGEKGIRMAHSAAAKHYTSIKPGCVAIFKSFE